MRLFFIYFSLLIYSFSFSQSSFEFENRKVKTVIPIKVVNNLTLIPVELNGVNLTFLLDTGVEETILFSLEEVEQVSLENIEKIKFKGFGIDEAFNGLKSSKNNVKIKSLIDPNHDVYVVLDQDINISSSVGVPVNGIIGYHFFKNHAVEINYDSKKIIVYDKLEEISPKKLQKFKSFPIELHSNKPYVNFNFKTLPNSQYVDAKLLVDSGNSDALWLFTSDSKKTEIPEQNIDDYLGVGFSGSVYGKRARIIGLQAGNFEFNNLIVAYPDSLNTKNIELVKDRLGSIGGEILKRFTQIFDYPSKQLFLKKNAQFNTKFEYNMSGIDVQHEGLEWVQEYYTDKPVVNYKSYDINGEDISKKVKTKFSLKPTYKIHSIRKKSPAEICGLKVGDKILSINHKKIYNLTLAEIAELLKSEENKEIKIVVERDDNELKFEFKLKKIL